MHFLASNSQNFKPVVVFSGNFTYYVLYFLKARSMAGSCNAASGSLVDVDIPELSESPWPGIDIFCTSMGLGGR